MNERNKQQDPYREKLLKELDKLKKCQEEKGVKSCLECVETVGCKTRNEYVFAVYESMNRGEGGGFEF